MGEAANSVTLICVYMLVHTWWCSRAGSGRRCCDWSVGRLLELKLEAVVREPCCILISSGCSQLVLGLENVCSPSCLCHCLNSRVSLSGAGMQLFLQRSFVPHVQPQLSETIFSMPGILGKRAKSRFLAPCSTCWSALHPSLFPRAVFLVCLPAQSQVLQAGGLSWRCLHTSYLA